MIATNAKIAGRAEFKIQAFGSDSRLIR